jgi:hypothetical protein
LYDFFVRLCDEIRRQAGKEPQFDSPDRLTGELVYEISDDLSAQWRVLGGMNGAAGEAVLVVTQRPARQLPPP